MQSHSVVVVHLTVEGAVEYHIQGVRPQHLQIVGLAPPREIIAGRVEYLVDAPPGIIVVMIGGISHQGDAGLAEVVDAKHVFGRRLGLPQRRQQHGRQDGDDGNHH